MNRKDKRFLEMAAKIAETSTCRFKHAAVVVRQGRVLAYSPNIQKNNPIHVDPKYCSVHAEIRALKKAGFPRKATIYVARVNRQAEPRMSKPCEGCMSLIEELKCRAVWT